MVLTSGRRVNHANAKDSTVAPTILVVEDEVLTRMSISSYLSDCGYRVIEAGSGDEAVAVMGGERCVDVVFSDVRMPGSLDGLALAQWIRRERPTTQVILTSGTSTRAAPESPRTSECVPLLAKPYEPADVERRIIRALSRV